MRPAGLSLLTNLRIIRSLSLPLLLVGCAHLPDATVQYYLPKTEVSFGVIRTVACDSNNYVLMADVVTPTVSHVADRDAIKKVSLASMRGKFSDSDVKFEYYDDGRLQGFNGASTGQGEAILKTAITTAGAIVMLGGVKIPHPTECAAIRKLGGEKPLALTYQGKFDLRNKQPQPLPPEHVSQIIIDQHSLSGVVGNACAMLLEEKAALLRSSYAPKEGDILLSLREPGLAKIKVAAECENIASQKSIWEGYVTVAQFGTFYDLPLPPPTTFGKRGVAASFSESGALKLVQFTSDTGVGQALNIMNAAYTTAEEKTTAEKAAAIQAKADLIAQQQRLLQCLAEPKNCK